MSRNRLANWAAVVVLAVATVYGFYWIWGAMFVFWAVNSIATQITFLLFPITRKEDPVLYWLVSIGWFAFGIIYLVWDGLWRLGIYSLFGLNLYEGFQ